MSSTVFSVDDIHRLRLEREAEYSTMTQEQARLLLAQRADVEWLEILKLRSITNDFYKCQNILTRQPDRLPTPCFVPTAKTS